MPEPEDGWRIEVLPEAQRALWTTGMGAPKYFVLYGGTALALRLGHRQSLDFVFFSTEEFTPEVLLRELPHGREATLLQSGTNTLTLLTSGSESVKLSFFGGLPFAPVKAPDIATNGIAVASFEDLYATKLAAAVQRSEAKDYTDIAALIEHGFPLEYGLGCAIAFYGTHFTAALPLKALVYSDDGDLSSLPNATRATLIEAVRAVRDIPNIAASGQRIGLRR